MPRAARAAAATARLPHNSLCDSHAVARLPLTVHRLALCYICMPCKRAVHKHRKHIAAHHAVVAALRAGHMQVHPQPCYVCTCLRLCLMLRLPLQSVETGPVKHQHQQQHTTPGTTLTYLQVCTNSPPHLSACCRRTTSSAQIAMELVPLLPQLCGPVACTA